MKTYKTRHCKHGHGTFDTRDCPTCTKDRVTKWREDNREEYNEYQKNKRKNKKIK